MLQQVNDIWDMQHKHSPQGTARSDTAAPPRLPTCLQVYRVRLQSHSESPATGGANAPTLLSGVYMKKSVQGHLPTLLPSK